MCPTVGFAGGSEVPTTTNSPQQADLSCPRAGSRTWMGGIQRLLMSHGVGPSIPSLQWLRSGEGKTWPHTAAINSVSL